MTKRIAKLIARFVFMLIYITLFYQLMMSKNIYVMFLYGFIWLVCESLHDFIKFLIDGPKKEEK